MTFGSSRLRTHEQPTDNDADGRSLLNAALSIVYADVYWWDETCIYCSAAAEGPWIHKSNNVNNGDWRVTCVLDKFISARKWDFPATLLSTSCPCSMFLTAVFISYPKTSPSYTTRGLARPRITVSSSGFFKAVNAADKNGFFFLSLDKYKGRICFGRFVAGASSASTPVHGRERETEI